MTIEVVAGAAVIFCAQLVLVRVVLQQRAALARLEDRMGQLRAGVSLLTDTAEVGLKDVAREIGRMSSVEPKTRARATVTRRITGLAKRGRSVSQIAADEQLSEGEVRLRLTLADAGVPGESDAAMR